MGETLVPPSITQLIADLQARVARLERGGTFWHARMTWNGAVAMTTNTHYAFGSGTGATSLGITGTSQFDIGGMLDVSNGKIVAPSTGVYLGVLQASWAASATEGAHSANIRRNQADGTVGTIGGVAGATNGTVGASNSTGSTAVGIWVLAAGACMEATFYQNIGVNLNITAITFEMAYLSATPTGL